MKKKILFFTAIILFSATVIFAQGGTTGPLTWNIDNGTLTISGEGEMPDYGHGEVPWYVYRASIYTVVMESGVTKIGNSAFFECTTTTSFTIPGSVVIIGDYAFLGCISTPSIIIPNGVTTIGKYAFRYCTGLISITIPDGVTTIEAGTFKECYSLTSITIPNSITTIKNRAFDQCKSIVSITIPDGITTFNEGIFAYCTSLTSITIPNSVKTIGERAFDWCLNLISITIPESVTTIGDYAFSECTSLISVTIPNSVTKIGALAFVSCISLPSIIIPNSVTTIENRTFASCQNLTSVIIPNSVTKIENYSFFLCTNLPSITIPNSVTSIGEGAFLRCKTLSSVTIPSGVTKIENYAFSECTNLISIEVESGSDSYTSETGILFNKDRTTLICYPAGKIGSSYTIPSSVTKVEDGAVSACPNLTSIEVENGNNNYTSEGGVLFNKDKTTLVCYPLGKQGTSYMIPNSVTTIGTEAFYYCPNLTSMTIPNSVTTIGRAAFLGCTSLTSIIIPKSVKKIVDWSFSYCPNLTSITNLNPKPVTISEKVFANVPYNACTLTVPTSAVSAYQSANVWKEFNIIGGGILVNPVANNNQYGATTGDGLYQQGETATVTATAHENYKFVKWTKDGAEVSTENTYSFTVTEDVELVAVFEKNVGIVETDNYPSLRVYPNPTRGVLHVETQCIASLQDVEIYDVMGRMVYTVKTRLLRQAQQPLASLQDDTTTLDISCLPSGIYFIRIQTENGTVTRKIIKN